MIIESSTLLSKTTWRKNLTTFRTDNKLPVGEFPTYQPLAMAS